MNRYLVVSCEIRDFANNFQDTFYHDFVLAESEDAAKRKVLAVRDYCESADVIDLQTLRTHLDALSTWSDEQIDASWQKILDNHEVA